jgi:hypothetical protein
MCKCYNIHMDTNGANPTRSIRLYSCLTLLMGIVAVYEGSVAHNTYAVIFGIALSVASIFLIALRKWAIHLVAALMIGGTGYWVLKMIGESYFGFLKESTEPLTAAFKIYVDGLILLAVCLVMIPTIYVWTKRSYLK